jgi:hypothetical protein
LRTIKDMTSHLEVSQCTTGEWEKAILQGFELWRAVVAERGGRIAVDLDARRIHYLGRVNPDQHAGEERPGVAGGRFGAVTSLLHANGSDRAWPHCGITTDAPFPGEVQSFLDYLATSDDAAGFPPLRSSMAAA